MPPIPVNDVTLQPRKRQRTENPSMLDIFEESDSDFEGYERMVFIFDLLNQLSVN